MVPGQNQQHLRSFVRTNPPRHKNSSFANHTELQEGCHQTVGQHGVSRYRSSALNHQRPDGVVPEATSDGRGHRGGGPPLKKYHRDSSFYVNYQNGPGEQRRRLLLWTSLVMRARHINTYQKSVRTSQH